MPLNRTEQSKVNGSKSRGPVTEAGRQRSARNRTTHGMYSTRVVLESESQEIFRILAGFYHDVFQPQDQFETDLVETLINSRWKIRRLEAAHTAEIDLTLAEHRVDIKYKYPPKVDPATLTALAYRISAQNIEILEKHLERQEKQFARTYRTLCKHRRNQPVPSLEDLHNIEQEVPSNEQNERFEPEIPAEPTPATPTPIKKERFEPEGPNPFEKIAIILVIVFTSIALSLWNEALRPEWMRA